MTECDSIPIDGTSLFNEKKFSKQSKSTECQKFDPSVDFIIPNNKTKFNKFKSERDSSNCETIGNLAKTKDLSLESDLFCDFTEPHHLTMTIRRPENILKLLSESKEDGSNNCVNAIIRSQKDSNSPSELSSKVLTSKEFCSYLKSYKLTIKPFGATKSKSKTREISKTNFSTVSRWRCVVNRPKPKPSKLKWHHTNFVNKPRPSSASIPPFVTSLAQAYQDLVTRDLALEETLKITPIRGPSMYVTRQDDPCLLSASEVEKSDLHFFSASQLDLQADNKKELESPLGDKASPLRDELYNDTFETLGKTREAFFPIRTKHRKNICNEKSPALALKQSKRTIACFGKESAKREAQPKKDQTEAMEIQAHTCYSVQPQATMQSGCMTSHFFPEIDLPNVAITDDILSDDGLFDDPNSLMREFFTEPNFSISDLTNSCDSRGNNYFNHTEIQDPLAVATSSVLTSVTQEMPLPSSPPTMDRTPSYEYPSYPLDDSSSSDSGIHSPGSMTSPISDIYNWQNDKELKNCFEYPVAPIEMPSPTTIDVVPDNVRRKTSSCSPGPQLWNLDEKPSVVPSPLHDVAAPIFEPINSALVKNPSDYVVGKHETMPNVTEPSKSGTNRPSKTPGRRPKGKNAILWEFIRDILLDPVHCPSLIKWEDRNTGLFRFVQSDTVAAMWGKKKGNPKMNYEKLSRAMRYYYNRGILDRVDGRRLVYKFGANAHGWRKASEPESPVKNIAPIASPTKAQAAESQMASSWLDSLESNQTNFQFISQESNGFPSMEARSTAGHIVTLPSASVLLPKWESAL